MAFQEVSAQNVDVLHDLKLNSDSGNPGEAIYKPITGGDPVWKKITGLCSKFIDTTDSSQDLAVTAYNINFNKEIFNDANIGYNSNYFVINDQGYYKLSLEALLNSDQAQVLIGFYVNGSLIFNNLSTVIPGGTFYSPYFLETVYYFNSGDILTVVSDKYLHEPCFLMRDPIYNAPVTQLLIVKQ